MAAHRRPLALQRRRLRPVCLAAACAVAMAALPAAWALPEGAVPTSGQAQLLPSAPGTLQILQTSPRAGFDWRSFHIAAGERVQVLQPNAQSILFNRVTGADPSLILGQLQSNGRVFLSNPRGIVFGAGAQVDVGGLLATTLSVNTTALADGRWQLSGGDAGTGLLRVDGSIRAPGGTVALVGPHLSVGGHILAGRLGLAAAGAAQVDVDGDGLIFFNLRDENLAARLQLLPAASLLARSAELRAAARSQFADTVLNLEGVVRAQGLVRQDGQVVIGAAAPQILVDGGAGGVTRVAGTLDASATGAGETGGQVRVLGERVWLDSTARIDARGDAGGGLVHVGGAWQGAGPDRNALHTRMAAGALIDASAIGLGDGGQVVVWADDSTVFNGHIRARGGLLGGDGGAVETSGKLRLGIGSGNVDAGAAAGFRAGRWLLDPEDINVKAPVVPKDPPDPSDPIGVSDGSVDWDDLPTTLNITAAALQGANANVRLQATRDVTIDAAVSLNAGHSFSAEAGRHVVVTANGSVKTLNQPISLVASKDMDGAKVGDPPTSGDKHDADKAGRVSVQGSLDAGTGSITIGSPGSDGRHLLGNGPTPTSITAGSLTVEGATALGSAIQLAVDSLTLAGPVSLAADTAISVAAGRSITIAGAIGDGSAADGARSLTKLGTGSLSLTGANAYRGGTVVADGTLRVSADSQLGDVAGGVTLQNGATLAWNTGAAPQITSRALELGSGGGTLDVTGTLNATGALSGSGTLSKAGSGTLSLAGDGSAFLGAVRLDAGRLALDSASALAGTTAVALAASADSTLAVNASTTLGALSGGAAGATPFGSVVIADGQVLSADGDGTALAARISGDGKLAKVGAGTLRLTGANTHTGGTEVSTGALQLGSAEALPIGRDVRVGGGVLDLQNQPASIDTLRLTGGEVRNGTLSANLFDLQSGTLQASLGGSGRLQKSGAGTVSLRQASPAFTGNVLLIGGTLSLDAAGALNAANLVSLDGPAGTRLAVNADTSVQALDGNGNGAVAIAAGSTLSFGGPETREFRGGISGDGGVVKQGSGSVRLSGQNTYTGGTTLTAGTLVLSGGNALVDAGTVQVELGATLQLADSEVVGTLSGSGTVALGSSTLTTGTAADSSFSGRIAGTGNAGSLVKAGGGQLILSGNNQIGGGTRVAAGTLALGSAGALADGNAVQVDSGATLLLQVDKTLAGLSGTGTVDLGGQRLTLDSAADLSFGGRIEGTGRLQRQGGGGLTLSGSNRYTGGTTVLSGTLRLANGAALADTGTLQLAAGSTLALDASETVGTLSGAGRVALGGHTLTVQAADDAVFSGDIGGVGALVKRGAGLLALGGTNTQTGGTTVADGRLVVNTDAQLGAPGAALQLDGGALRVDVFQDLGLGASRPLVLGAGGGTLITEVGAMLTLDGPLQGSGRLVKQGPGLLRLQGDNRAHVGDIAVQAGALRVAGGQALPDARAVSLAAGTLLGVETTETVGGLAGTGSVDLAGSTQLRLGTEADASFNGNIGGFGRLVKIGEGTLTLGGINNQLGGTEVMRGMLAVRSDANLGSSLAPLRLDGGTLRLDAAGVVPLAAGRALEIGTAGGTVLVSSAGATLDLAGSLTGAGTLHKQGAGSLRLAGPGTDFSGAVDLAAGSLRLAGAQTLRSSASVALDAAATLLIDASLQLGQLTGSGHVSLASGAQLTLGTVADQVFNGSFSGAGSLAKVGAGALTLTADSSHDGGIRVQQGRLLVSRDAQLGAATGTLTLDGGALGTTGSSPVALAASRSLQLDAAGGTLATTADASLSLAGPVVGSGALVKAGAGSLTLAGHAGSYNGTVSVQAGRLVLGSAQALGAVNGLQLDAGSTLQVQQSLSLASVAGAGAVVLDAGATLSTGFISSRFDGALSGDGALRKQGGGTLTLAGANSQRGTTDVQGGTLRLEAGLALPDDTAVTVGAGGTLQVASSERLGTLGGSGSVQLLGTSALTVGSSSHASFDGSFSGTGSLVKQGSGTLTLGGIGSHGGGTTVAAGVLAVSADAALGAPHAPLVLDGGRLLATGGGTVALAAQRAVVVDAGGGTLAADAGTTLRLDDALLGAGSLSKAGAGTLVLAAASPGFSGAVQVGAGTLALQQTGALGPANAVAVAAGSTLDLGADVQLGPLSGAGAVQLHGVTLAAGGGSGVFSGTLGGSQDAVLRWLGGGQLSLTGATGFVGRTEVLGGSLALAQADALTDSPVSLAPGATLAVLSSSRVQSLSQPGATGGDVQIAAGATLSTGGVADTRFDGRITGDGALRKLGSGRFTLGGSSSHTGGTQVDAGTLQGDSRSLQGDIAVATELVFDQADAGSYAGRLSGAGRLVKQGGGSLLLSGAHQHAGGTEVRAGALRLTGGQAVPDAGTLTLAAGAMLQVEASETLARLDGTGSVQLQDTAALTLGDATDMRFDGTLAGGGGLVKQGSGQLTLGGASGHRGGTLVQAGRLLLATPEVLAHSTVTLDSADGVALQLLGDARIGALASSDGPGTPVVALDGFQLAVGGNGASTRFAGRTSRDGSLVKQGDGVLTLAGDNAHTGPTRVQAGRLVLAGGQTLDLASALQVDAGAGLVLAAPQTVGPLTGAGAVQLGAFSLTSRTDADAVFAGQISGDGGLVKQGGGRLTLSGSNLFTGMADVQQGTLALAGGAALADAASLQIGGAGTVVAADSETVGALAGSGALVLEAGRFTTGGHGGSTVFGGTISGGGQLAKEGAGTLTLSGLNSHTGGLALLGGTLAVASDSALGAVPDAGTPASLLFDGGTLQATGSFGIATARQLLLQGAGGTLQVDAGHTLALPAALADGSSAGSLTKTGAGTLALAAATDSARSGSTQVLAGTLALQRDGQLGLPAGALVLDGGTLQVDSSLRLADARLLQLGAAGGTLAVGGGATLALAGLVTDRPGASGGALAKTGAGQLLLDGAADNTYTGATLLRGGSLALQRDGQLGAAPARATPGQLLIDGATLQVGGDTVLAASRGLALGAAGATLDVADGRTLILAGTIGDAPGAAGGALSKTGGGLLRLQAGDPSSHTGATRVLAGTLALSADAQLGAAPGQATPGHLLLDGGTLRAEAGFSLDPRRGLMLGAGGGVVDVAAGQQLGYAGVLAGVVADPAQGALTKAGAGRLALAGDNTYAGATRVRGGTLAIQGDGQLGSAPATATPGHLLLDGGTLAVGGSGALAASRGIALGAGGAVLEVAAGASLVYDGALADAPGASGGIDKTGGGSLVLGGVSSHGGSTRVLAGSLATSGAQRLPETGALLLANQASLVLGGDQTLAALGDAPNPGGEAADGSALVDLGRFTLRLNTGAGDDRSFYSGAVTGIGGQLLKRGGGTLQLAGSGAGRNLVTVDDGLLVSLGSNSLSAGAEVTVAPGAALRLMAPVTVQSLDLSGQLSGPGGLTAFGSVDLRSAVVDTTVATPVLRSQGISQLHAAVQADSSTITGGTLTLGAGASLASATLTVQGGGTLATQATGQLPGRPAVVVDSGTLQLAGAEQAATLMLAGTLASAPAGGGRLAVDHAATLQGASVLAALDAASLRSSGATLLGAAVVARDSATLTDGRLTLADGGSLGTPLLTLQAGTLATGATPALSTGSRLVVQRDATLLLGADQRLASLDLAGTLGAPPAAPAARVPEGQQRALAEAGPAAQLRVDGAVALDGASIYTPLAAATLTTRGAATLAAPVQADGGTTVVDGLLTVAASGLLSTPSLQVQAGGVATGGSQRLQPDTRLALAAGTTLQLGGDQTLARLADLGAAGSAAQVQLGSFTLSAGADGSDAVFSGRFNGDGTVAKQGSGTWLLRSDHAHGDTRIEAGTLQLGDGGRSGSLGRGAVVNAGVLRFQRDDDVRLTQDVSGSGSLQQAGSGSLSLASTGLRYTGDTIVSAGSLRTEGADRLPDASHLRLAAGTRLATGGDDRLGALTAEGAVSLGGSLATTGDQLFNGPVTVASATPVTLSAPGGRIEAQHAGNQWGSQPLSVDAAALQLGAGRSGGAAEAAWNPLTLGQVTLRGGVAGAAASQIDAATLQIGAPVAEGRAATGDARIDGLLDLRAGSSLALRAHATPGHQVPVPAAGELVAVDPLRGREIALADDTLWQNTHSVLRSEGGARLQLQATGGGSIRLGQTANRLEGAVSALSGRDFNAAWAPVDVAGGRQAGQSSITLAGEVVQVGGGGIEADVLRLAVGRLGTEAASPLAARLWYNDAGFGKQRSLPGLQITLLPGALAVPSSLGSPDQPVQVRVGAQDTGGRTDGLNAGYVQLLPRQTSAGGAAVFLAGPKVGQAAYSFFQDGAGDVAGVPLFYNNVLPATPQLAGSLSAVASVSETARRERFDETVRTENVAIRLRAGVIAEVGPGRPATQGTQGIRLPSSCSTVGNLLGCGDPP